MNIIIASTKPWHKTLADNVAKKTQVTCHFINNNKNLDLEYIKQINPEYIFFPHWSTIIPKIIFSHYECVVFHITDLPFGRGGSPLQNLISRGIYETKISAVRCNKTLDGGPIYMKKPFNLHGRAEDIYIRLANEIEKMMISIIKNRPEPVEQTGPVTYFKRRKPAQSSVANLKSVVEVYDFIRMLDAPDYPKAFLDTNHIHIEFSNAAFENNKIKADVVITSNK